MNINNSDLKTFKFKHRKFLKLIKEYNFAENKELIKQALDDCKICDEEIKILVDNKGNIYLQIDVFDGFRDIIFHYLFDAFNVYEAKGKKINFVYSKNEELTQKWRKIMKNNYPNSNYAERLERIEYIEGMNEDIFESL